MVAPVHALCVRERDGSVGQFGRRKSRVRLGLCFNINTAWPGYAALVGGGTNERRERQGYVVTVA